MAAGLVHSGNLTVQFILSLSGSSPQHDMLQGYLGHVHAAPLAAFVVGAVFPVPSVASPVARIHALAVPVLGANFK